MDAKAANVSGDLAKVFLVGSLDAEKSLVVARTGYQRTISTQ
jgi:hypothetical protein